jgi:type IX secretion system PorP/SprF family membrane protein
MKNLFLAVVLYFLSTHFSTLHAQQLPLLTQYREMQGIINPAAISRDFIRLKHNVLVGTSYRRQWMDAPQAPSTLMLQGEWLKETGNTHLISGLYVVDDKVGKESTTSINNRLGVLISDNPQDYGFALGLTGGMVHYRVKLSETSAHDADPNISSDRQKWHPDIGAGLFGYMKLANDNLLYGGLSVPQIFGFNALQLSENQEITRYRHYYLMGGCIVPLNTESSSIEFSTWAKFVPNVMPNADFNVRFNYNDQFQVGVGFNTNKSVALEAAYTLGAGDNYDFAGLWQIGYSYNLSFSPIANYLGNTHEVHLSVAFGGH